MEGLLERPPMYAPAGQGWSLPADGVLGDRVARYLSGRRLDSCDMLPQWLARKCVEGGAPYLGATGTPRYPPNEHDTGLTYPVQVA